MGGELAHYLDSARNLLTITVMYILAASAFMFIIHLLGIVVFNFLKTRRKFPVYKTYLTTVPAEELHHLVSRPDLVMDESTDSEEGEDEETLNTHKTYPPPPPRAQTLLVPSDKLKGLLRNYRYSETKV